MDLRRIKRHRSGALALAAALGLMVSAAGSPADAHCGSCGAHAKHTSESAQKDIVDTAVAAGDFKTLVAAVKAAGLAEVLKGEGPFTVFAPTDEAFAALPKGTVEELLKPENKKKLTSILTYHVVSGRVNSEQALEAKSAVTLQKSKVSIEVKKGTAMVNDAKLVKTDIEATNGIIHVIDKVLMPTDKLSAVTK